jgi:hypothetical protein
MKINKIKRLYEDDMTQIPVQQFQQIPQMQAPMPAQTQMSMPEPMSMAGDELEFAAPLQTSSGIQVGEMPSEISQMTVGDFLQKCKNVDALICIGIESFLEKNKEAFMGEMPSDLSQSDDLENIEFGAGEEDTLPELEFPVEQPQSM